MRLLSITKLVVLTIISAELIPGAEAFADNGDNCFGTFQNCVEREFSGRSEYYDSCFDCGMAKKDVLLLLAEEEQGEDCTSALQQSVCLGVRSCPCGLCTFLLEDAVECLADITRRDAPCDSFDCQDLEPLPVQSAPSGWKAGVCCCPNVSGGVCGICQGGFLKYSAKPLAVGDDVIYIGGSCDCAELELKFMGADHSTLYFSLAGNTVYVEVNIENVTNGERYWLDSCGFSDSYLVFATDDDDIVPTTYEGTDNSNADASGTISHFWLILGAAVGFLLIVCVWCACALSRRISYK